MSSRLADAYLSDLDRVLREEEGVIFSARYVDDVMVVADPQRAHHILEKSRSVLLGLGLAANESKTEVRHAHDGTFSALSFLGYEFRKPGSTLCIRLPPARVVELRRRLDLSFAAWSKSHPTNTGRQGLLLSRVRLLTGNYRLEHNRRRAIVGSYFSYPLLNDLSQFFGLDRYLDHHISKLSFPAELEAKLRACSFVDGFSNRTFWKPTSDEMKKMVGAWRGAT